MYSKGLLNNAVSWKLAFVIDEWMSIVH